MQDFKLLRQTIANHLFIIIMLVLLGAAFIGCSFITFHFTSGFGRYLFSGFFGLAGLWIWYFAITTNISSCQYYYERAVLKKYGVKTQAKLVEKTDESSGVGEINFVLDYVYSWQGKEYRGCDAIENQRIFDVLEPGAEIPIIILATKPSSSNVQTGKLKRQYQIVNKNNEPDFQDDLLSLDVKPIRNGLDIK